MSAPVLIQYKQYEKYLHAGNNLLLNSDLPAAGNPIEPLITKVIFKVNIRRY